MKVPKDNHINSYFLYKGRHFEDITEMTGEAQKRYRDIEFVLPTLGVHENIAKVVLEGQRMIKS